MPTNFLNLQIEMLNFHLANIQTIAANWLVYQDVFLDILRLDKIHPVVSGNKWFKLKYYLEEAKNNNQDLITFGGAWSNHIVATAYCCQQAGIKCIGIIRGEKPKKLSQTIISVMEYGMDLRFVGREEYGILKHEQRIVNNEYREIRNGPYFIPEGGYGGLGVKGAADIGKIYDLHSYTHIIAGVGTGTMLAGLILSAMPYQKIIGISSMKGNNNLVEEIQQLLHFNTSLPNFEIIHDYHFGGFGKYPKQLIDFMNETFIEHELPLDIVYTGKTFFAIKDLIERKYFPKGSKILMIHSGGLQGNKSVEERLMF